MKPPLFFSPLAERMISFIAFKRMQGHSYACCIGQLRRFDTFLRTTDCREGVLRIQDIEGYRAACGGRSTRTQAGALSTIRQFSLYLHAMEPRSAVVPLQLVPRQPRPIRFHPLSETQVVELMAAAQRGADKDELAAHCIRFLIGLLYSTGLRISEATALNEADVDRRNATLFVRRGKFRKERLVPMSPSTLQAVCEWLDRRQPYAGGKAVGALLVAGWNQRLTSRRAARCFRRLCVQCGLTSSPPPRLHDLRHNYASRRLALWRNTKEDVEALLPVLANAMGHVDFFATQVYLHIDAADLQQASARFHAHVYHITESSL